MGASFLLVLLGFIAAWTPLFFGLHRPDLGFLDIMPVWLTIIATIARFCPINGGQLCCSYPTSHGASRQKRCDHRRSRNWWIQLSRNLGVFWPVFG
jgi:hypothetical protein